jgi:hypothetical protein
MLKVKHIGNSQIDARYLLIEGKKYENINPKDED